MTTRIGVRAVFSAAHRDLLGRWPVHGHTYTVVAWFSGGDQVDRQARLVALLAEHYDHRTLGDHLARSEDLAADILERLDARGVEVNREAEGLYARAGRCG